MVKKGEEQKHIPSAPLEARSSGILLQSHRGKFDGCWVWVSREHQTSLRLAPFASIMTLMVSPIASVTFDRCPCG